MVTSSSSMASSSPHLPAENGLDSPPSYDYVTSLPLDDYPYAPGAQQAGGSSSSAPANSAPDGISGSGEARGPPKHIEHLFSGPPNAERLLARNSTPLERVAAITTHKKWGRQVTFDPALQDPDTLYDFLRYQALQAPSVKFKIRGTHLEHHQRDETVPDRNGRMKHRRKNETERVIDFDFWIDLNTVLEHPDNMANIYLRALDAAQPAHRGTNKKHYGAQYRAPSDLGNLGSNDGYAALLPSGEYSATDAGARAGSRDEGYTAKERAKYLWAKGLPAWIDVGKIPEFWANRAGNKKGKRSPNAPIALPDSPSSASPSRFAGRRVDEEATGGNTGDERWRSEQALRAWCVKYCQDPSLAKSFEFGQWVWGWEIAALETAVRGAILSTGYQSNDVTAEVEVTNHNIMVRPPNLLSRILWDTPWFLMPLVILLCPLIWLWQTLFPVGVAPYSVARASYAFKFYPPLPSTFPNETLEAAQDRLPALYKLHPELPKSPVLQPGPKGIHYLLGRKEGEWFREWEERIRMGVTMRYQGQLQNTRVGEQEAPALDGY